MSAKERILAIRLMEHMENQARFTKTLGIEAAMTRAQPRENINE